MPQKKAGAAPKDPRVLRQVIEDEKPVKPDEPLITPANCAYICDYAKKRAGLVLDKDRLDFIGRRLKPVARSCGILSVDDLVSQLKKNLFGDLGAKITDALTTNESLFFRDIKPFDVLSKEILPSILENKKGSKTLRIWCAAASTGQEPYSVAMTVKNNEKLLEGWRCNITATDICREALQFGEKGSYTQFDVQRGLPAQELVKHFEKVDDRWQINKELQSMISFQELNLMDDFKNLAQFDIVFCRNVLIYFDVETKREVLSKIKGVMAKDGALFIGCAESMVGISEDFKPLPGGGNAYSPT